VPAVEQIPISEKEVTPEKPKLPEKIEEVVSPPIEEKKIITPTVEEKAVQPEEKKIEEVVTQPEEKEPEPEEIITPPVEEKIIQPELKEEKPPVAEKPEIVPEVKPIEEEAKVEKPTKVKPIEPKPKVKPVDPSEKTWIPEFPWALKVPTIKVKPTEPEKILSLKDAISAMNNKSIILEGREGENDERGVKLPMQSLLQIEGYKSVMIEYSKVHYFGNSDINRYQGYYSSGLDYGSYDSYGSGSGYDSYGSNYGSNYGSSYDSYGSNYGNNYGSNYGSNYGTGYGGDTRSSGINIQQELDVHLHGRIGPKTHVDVDYNDTGRSQFGGMGQKEQKIRVWYQGDKDEIIQKAAFGDISLDFPSSRFINVSRNLFGAELVARLGDVKFTLFGTRTKGIKETWSSSGQSRQAGGGIGNRIMDINYIKERYYALNVGTDGMIFILMTA
jgi:hypothetical protein